MFRKARERSQQGLCFDTKQYERTFSLILQETVNLGNGTIEGNDGEFVVSDVHDQVLAHDGQTDEAEVTTGNCPRRSADIDAGETSATVSSQRSSTLSKIDSNDRLLYGVWII